MTETLRVRITDFVLQRDLRWQPSECDHCDLTKKLQFVTINRVDKEVQSSLLADKAWLKSREEEKQVSVTTRQVTAPAGYDSAVEVSVPMSEWGPDFFEKLNAGEKPTLRSSLPPEAPDPRALAMQASLDQLFEPGGIFDDGLLDEEDQP